MATIFTPFRIHYHIWNIHFLPKFHWRRKLHICFLQTFPSSTWNTISQPSGLTTYLWEVTIDSMTDTSLSGAASLDGWNRTKKVQLFTALVWMRKSKWVDFCLRVCMYTCWSHVEAFRFIYFFWTRYTLLLLNWPFEFQPQKHLPLFKEKFANHAIQRLIERSVVLNIQFEIFRWYQICSLLVIGHVNNIFKLYGIVLYYNWWAQMALYWK